jgi:hypothetical protein
VRARARLKGGDLNSYLKIKMNELYCIRTQKATFYLTP